MHKVCLKSPMRTLSLVLLIASAPSFAAYSDDADCQAVSNSAKNAATRIQEQINVTATNTGQAVERSKSCIDQLLDQANRSVPDFGGGGVGDLLAKYAKDMMAQQGCKLINNAVSQGVAAIPPIVTKSVNSVPTSSPSPTNDNTSGSSLWRRISGLF